MSYFQAATVGSLAGALVGVATAAAAVSMIGPIGVLPSVIAGWLGATGGMWVGGDVGFRLLARRRDAGFRRWFDQQVDEARRLQPSR